MKPGWSKRHRYPWCGIRGEQRARTMTMTPLGGFRLKVFRALQFFVPEGSSLDAVFNSYDDWRRYRAHLSQAKSGNTAAAQPSELSSQGASQQSSQHDSNHK